MQIQNLKTLLSSLIISTLFFPLNSGAQEHLKPLTTNSKPQVRYIAPEYEAKFYFKTGLKTDQLTIQTASDLTGMATPNISKEVAIENLKFVNINSGFSYTDNDKWNGFYGEGKFSWGNSMSGEARDSDYSGDNKTNETSRINSGAIGNNYGFSAALGYSLRWDNEDNVHRLIPMAGFSYDSLNISMKNASRAIGTGSVSALNNKYESKWKSPFIGASYIYNQDYKHYLELRGEYHFLSYAADLDWSLRSDLAHPKSFTHDGNGNGLILSLFYQYFLTEFFGVNLTLNHQEFNASGKQKTIASSGTTTTQKLKDVNWESTGIMGGISYKF